jgi:TonB family protein
LYSAVQTFSAAAMSVASNHSISAMWTGLEGRVVNGAFPLRRCIAGSDRSGVFITESAKHAPSAVALKLVRIDPESADLQLSHWTAAVGLSHPQLIRLYEAGQCKIGELHCLYALMEYADQTLAELLEQRALSEEEVREMMVPTLSVLSYLHDKKLVQGQLKPSNILVVGEQLKLAVDTVRPAGQSAQVANARSAYDAPETRDGIYSAAGDIWGLGITMCEALTRRIPSQGEADAVELPAELQPPFREIIERCLKRKPRDRPEIPELLAWLRQHQPSGAAPTSIQTPEPPLPRAKPAEPTADELTTTGQSTGSISNSDTSSIRLVIRAQIIPEEIPVVPLQPQWNVRAIVVALLCVVVVIALSWIGFRAFRNVPAHAASADTQDVASQLPPPVLTPSTAAAVISAAPSSKRATASIENKSVGTKTVVSKEQDGADVSIAPVKEVMPEVSRGSLQTIRGIIKISVRVTINKEGNVIAAAANNPGPSKYFERLAVDASKKWTFAPVTTDEQRKALVRFEFTRKGATARASPLH